MSESNPNMKLWNSVMKTDPNHTKPITGKAYQGNSPKPYYIVQRATETFGPCGIGWGFQIVEEKILQGALLATGFYEQIHMAQVRVWYIWDGKKGEVEHVGQTLFSGMRAGGKTFTDEDAPKKSVTDALVKALSMIGFAGDIFIGLYDDSKYVEGQRQEHAPKPTPKSEPTEAQKTVAAVKKATELAMNAPPAPEALPEYRAAHADTIAKCNKYPEAEAILQTANLA